MSTKRLGALMIVGGLLLLLALVLGQERFKYDNKPCGSALSPVEYSNTSADQIVYGATAADRCADKTADRQGVILGVGGLGVVLLGAGAYGRSRNRAASS